MKTWVHILRTHIGSEALALVISVLLEQDRKQRQKDRSGMQQQTTRDRASHKVESNDRYSSVWVSKCLPSIGITSMHHQRLFFFLKIYVGASFWVLVLMLAQTLYWAISSSCWNPLLFTLMLCMYTMAQLCRSEDMCESVLSFQQVHPGEQTQVVRCGGKYLYPLGHLKCHYNILLKYKYVLNSQTRGNNH